MTTQPQLPGFPAPPRPTITAEMVRDAAEQLVARNKWPENFTDDIVGAYSPHIDGYRLARELEDTYGWDISMEHVDELDCLDLYVREIHRKACWEWVRVHDIRPPLPIGAMTTRGEITGICDHSPASYLVRAHGEKDEARRYIVRFEDAQAAKEQEAQA